jgi:hypothetical protein
MTHRLPVIMTEGISSTIAMSRVAAEWREAKEADAEVLLLAEAGIKDPSEHAGSEDMTDPEYAARKRAELQKERAQQLRMVSAQVDVLLGAEHAAAAAAKGAALGAAKSTTFGH